MKNNWLITIIAIIVVGAAAFYGGMQYEKSKATTAGFGGQYAQGGQNSGGFRQGGNGRFGGRGGFGGATVGTIVSTDANSITVQLQDGSSKIVNISGSTTINKMAPASQSDLTTGTRVAAFGQSNSDGSITAQNIQVNPMMRGGQGTRPTPTQ